jgi:hypothetical protein
MSTLSVKQNVIYGLSEGSNVASTDYLDYALRWANAAYREIFLRYRFKHLRTRSVFRTADGQQTYQAPSDFLGFIVLKDESNDSILDQVTPEEFARDVTTTPKSSTTTPPPMVSAANPTSPTKSNGRLASTARTSNFCNRFILVP